MLEGLVMGQSVKENAALPSLDRRQRWSVVDRKGEHEVVATTSESLRLRAPSLSD